MPALATSQTATVNITSPNGYITVACANGDVMQVDWVSPGSVSGSRTVRQLTRDVGPFADDTVITLRAVSGNPQYTDAQTTAAQTAAIQILVAGTESLVQRARSQIGAQLWSWITTPPTLSHLGTTPTTTVADKSLGDSGILRLPYSSGTRAGCKITRAAAVNMSTRKVVRVVLRNNGTGTRLIQLRVGGDSGFVKAAYFNLVCNPGLNVFMLDTYAGSMQGGMTWALDGTLVQWFWFCDIGAVESGYSNMQPGDGTLDIGLVTIDATSRPMFLFVCDDAKKGVVERFTDYPAGYPTSGGTHFDIISAYGFRSAANLSIDEVNTAAFISAAQANYLKTNGWQVNINTNLPLTGAPYGTYETVLSEIRKQQAGLGALGFVHTDVFSGVPTGAIAEYVYRALYDAGVSVARLISAQTSSGSIFRPFGHITGQNGGLYSVGGVSFWSPPDMCVVNNSFQLDGALTTADVDAYVTALKLHGGIGSCYVHDITAATATLLDYLCQKIRTEVNAGAVEVVLPSDIRDIYRAVVARHKALYV